MSRAKRAASMEVLRNTNSIFFGKLRKHNDWKRSA